MAINAKRLLKLADFLETVPRAAFDLKNWQVRAADKPEGKRPGDCGFAGCAVGWAAHAKLFRGFSLIDKWDEDDLQPSYRGETRWHAIDALFGFEPIDHDWNEGEGEHLFMPSSYPSQSVTPKQVARRIREFVRERTTP